jgi:hypothetical protein
VSLPSVDPFLDREYHPRDFNCLHYAGEVWLAATGEDISEKLRSLHVDPRDRKIKRSVVRAFTRLDKPQDPSLVLMRRPRMAPHVGVYIRGRVLHITERGPAYQPLDVATFGFTSWEFYR